MERTMPQKHRALSVVDVEHIKLISKHYPDLGRNTTDHLELNETSH